MNFKSLTFIVITILVYFTAVSNASAEDAGQSYKVGIILPLSGEYAFIGNAVKNGIQMAVDELSPADRKRLELVYEDDSGVPKNTATAFAKLVTVNKVQAIVTALSGTSKAAAPLASANKVPLIAIASDGLVSKGRDNVVNFWVTPEEEVRVIIPEALKRGCKRIAILTATHDFPIAVRKTFEETNNGRLEIVYQEELSPDVKDFRTQLTKIKSLGVDAIFVNLFFGQAGLFARQAHELGVMQPLFTAEVFEDVNEVKLSAGALIGQWYAQSDEPTDTFVAAYQKRFPGASQFGAANGHDIVLLLAAGTSGNTSLNEYLHHVTDFHGATGTFSSTNDNRFTLPATIKLVTATGFEKAH